MIDNYAVEEYLTHINQKELDFSKFEITEFKKTDKTRFNEIENCILTNEQYQENIRQYWDKNSKKFES